MRIHVVDPPAFTPPYDHALCSALARAGAEVELVTSRFAYASAPAAEGYARREWFYRLVAGPAGSRVRRAGKLLEHVPDMLGYRRRALTAAVDVVHFQWLDVPWLDAFLLPRRPIVLTAHDLLPREPRPGQVSAQRRLYKAVDAIVVHSGYGRTQLVDVVGVPPEKVHVIPHGAFEHLTRQAQEVPLPDELRSVEAPVVMFFGLLRPYKGIEVLLEAWRGIEGAELWIVGRPRMALEPLQALAASAAGAVRFIPRFVSDAELPAYFRRAEVVVLPYSRTERFDQSGVLATALAFAKPVVLTDIGGFGEVAATGAARLVPRDDAGALRDALRELIADPAARERLAQAARRAAAGQFSWDQAARKTLELYASLLDFLARPHLSDTGSVEPGRRR
jgi:glycosyltransferase involved in cell wall biosynthesis